MIYKLLEVGDRDDDQQVEKHSKQRNYRKHNVIQNGARLGLLWLPAGGIVKMWEAQFTVLRVLHHCRRRYCGCSKVSPHITDVLPLCPLPL